MFIPAIRLLRDSSAGAAISFKTLEISATAMNTSLHSRLIRYKLAWLALPFIAIFNGVLRDLTYSHVFGEQMAHQISTILLIAIIVAFVILLNERIRLESTSAAWAVGFTWMVLTVLFELILTLLTGGTLTDNLNQYNIGRGNLWILVVITVCTAPVVLRRLPASRPNGNPDKYHRVL